MIKKFLKNSERGQAIILIAAGLVGLVAMIGLMTDGGILLIEYARLKRGIDAAAIAAAQQFRKDFTADDLENAAENFLTLNQSDVESVLIQTCDYPGTEHDAALCEGTRSKLVRVTASKRVTFGFMRVIGFNDTVVTATSVGEAAAIDLVLIMDTSLSMAYGTTGTALNLDAPGDDPHACNIAHTCQPLENIKSVARTFIQTLFFPYDRVAIVTMTDQAVGGTRNPTLILPFNDDIDVVDTALENLRVYEPPTCVRELPWAGQWLSPSKGICLDYDAGGTFLGQNRPVFLGGSDLNELTTGDGEKNPTTIPSSNVGGTFIKANNAFLGEGAPKRDDAFWVVIALISGPANATGTNDPINFPDGYCPQSTWAISNPNPKTAPCRDSDLAPDGITTLVTRHSRGIPGDLLAIPPVLPVAADINYDADDYARDAADDLANPVTGNGVAIFTIGLGTSVGKANSLRHTGLPVDVNGVPIPNSVPTLGLPTSGENLLIYAAEQAGDDPDHIPPNYYANHGQYYYAEDPTLDLGPIFLAIASNIFTRINQ